MVGLPVLRHIGDGGHVDSLGTRLGLRYVILKETTVLARQVDTSVVYLRWTLAFQLYHYCGAGGPQKVHRTFLPRVVACHIC